MCLRKVRKNIILLLIVCSVFCGSNCLAAKNLYVSTMGSDSVTYAANDVTHPWLTPLKAWTEADVGDTVYFRSGTYSFSSTINTHSIGHHGIESNPITFMSYPNETATLTYTGSAGGMASGAAVVIEKNWNIIKNFNLNGPSTFFMFGWDSTVVGGQVSGCTYNMTTGGDNCGLVLAYSTSSYITVDHNAVTCPGSGAAGNTAGVQAFNSPGFKALNNEITNCRTGIYYKHGQSLPTYDTGIEISGNYITGSDMYCMQLNLAYANISNNICGAGNGYLRTFESNGGPRSDHNTFDHNTLFNNNLFFGDDESPGAQYNTVTNNIIGTKAWFHPYSNYALESTFDYNSYPSGDAVYSNYTNYSLSAWQSLSGEDANSVTGAVTYTGGSTPSTIAGYTLTSGSIGYLSGSDGKSLGADVALVGSGGVVIPASLVQPPTLRLGVSSGENK